MRKAFSFIELMVVMAIIAILAALIIPLVLREKSKRRINEDNHYVTPQISSRFTVDSQGELPNTGFNCLVITDKNSGKQYLIVYNGGIIELPPLQPEKAKEQREQ